MKFESRNLSKVKISWLIWACFPWVSTATFYNITYEKRRLDLYIYCSNDWWIRIALNMTSQCSIEDFPPEILQLLFGQLNLKDLGNCSKTCVRWKLLIVDLFKNKGNYKGYIPFLKLSFLFKLRRHSITTWKRWGTR